MKGKVIGERLTRIESIAKVTGGGSVYRDLENGRDASW